MRGKFLVSVLVVLMCFIFCMCQPPTETKEKQKPKPNSKEQYLYMRLALCLPSTFGRVNSRSRQNRPKHLVITSFHPIKAKYSDIDGISILDLNEIKDSLLTYWPKLTLPADIFDSAFYKQIYRDDGRSCDGTLRGKRYFCEAITLSKLHHEKIYMALTSYGTPPSETATYSASAIKEAIRRYTGTQPQLTCSNLDDIIFLYEIMVCFDKSGGFVNCEHEAPPTDNGKKKRATNCDNIEHIIIPPL